MLLKFIEKIQLWIAKNELQTQVIRGSTGSFFVYIIFAALSLAISISLARFLGADGYGAYANAIAWSNTLIPFATFGFTTLLVRDIAIFRAQKNWSLLKGLLKFSDQFIFILSIIVMLFFYGVDLVLFSGPEKQLMFRAILIAVPLIPLWAFAYLRQSSIRGLENATRSLIPDMVIRPGLLLVIILIMFFFLPQFLNINTVMVISIFSSALALFLAAYWLKTALPLELNNVPAIFQIKSWIKTSFPLFVFGSMQIVLPQIPVIMLGVFSSADQVGLFSASYRIANTLAFLPGAIRIVMGPIIARMYAENENLKLQRLLTLTVRFTFFFDIVLGLIFILLRKPFLAIFGLEFIVAQWALIILIIGNIIDALMGNSSVLLAMIGKERIVAKSYVFIVITNIILNFFLIPQYGFLGASIASTLCLILVKIILSIYTLKKTGLNTTILTKLLN
jgi:O-antigen/teichoic acid export membrane protein